MLGFFIFLFLFFYTWMYFSPVYGFSSPVTPAALDVTNQTWPLPPSEHNATASHHPFVKVTLKHADAAYHALQDIRASILSAMVRLLYDPSTPASLSETTYLSTYLCVHVCAISLSVSMHLSMSCCLFVLTWIQGRECTIYCGRYNS